MSNMDTVKAITDNLQAVLQTEGIKFSRKAYDDEKAIPASLVPFGQIFYRGENFEYTHGQRPGYAEGEFKLRVVLRGRNPADLMRSQQEWVHKIRGALTVDALNVGDLASTGYVSRVVTKGVDIENRENFAFLNYMVAVRYREV
jgi:hypothetical protein